MQDKVVAELMDDLTQKLRADGRQVLMVVDKFSDERGENLSSVEVSKKCNGVMSMLVDLINSIYASRGIDFSTAYEFLGRKAKEQGLM